MNPQSFVPVTLARILRPWGRRGEVAAEIFTDFPRRLSELSEVWLADGRKEPRRISLLSCRIHLGQAILQFAGIDSISAAEGLRGLEVQVPIDDRAPIGPDRVYISDLIGCEVWEQGATSALGAVRDVQRAGEQGSRSPESWFLVVAGERGELLIPLAAEICTAVDIPSRRIAVRLPEGLRDLNAP